LKARYGARSGWPRPRVNPSGSKKTANTASRRRTNMPFEGRRKLEANVRAALKRSNFFVLCRILLQETMVQSFGKLPCESAIQDKRGGWGDYLSGKHREIALLSEARWQTPRGRGRDLERYCAFHRHGSPFLLFIVIVHRWRVILCKPMRRADCAWTAGRIRPNLDGGGVRWD